MSKAKLSKLGKELLNNPVIKAELLEAIDITANFQDGVPSGVRSKVTARKVMARLDAVEQQRLADIATDSELLDTVKERLISNQVFPQVQALFAETDEKELAKLEDEYKALIALDKAWTEIEPTFAELARIRQHRDFLAYLDRMSH